MTAAAIVPGAEAFSYVDANNDGVYDPLAGDVKLGAEVADGKFDTGIAEGNYKKVVPGAGLVLGGKALTAFSINFAADGLCLLYTSPSPRD